MALKTEKYIISQWSYELKRQKIPIFFKRIYMNKKVIPCKLM